MDRSFSKKIYPSSTKPYKEFETRIQNYACHCFPQDEEGNIIGGKGAVVNTVDKICKQLYDCHTCIKGEELGGFFVRYLNT